VDGRRRPPGAAIEILKSNSPTASALAYVPHHGAFSEANARLIAAAPEMFYRLCEANQELFDPAISALIARVKGEA